MVIHKIQNIFMVRSTTLEVVLQQVSDQEIFTMLFKENVNIRALSWPFSEQGIKYFKIKYHSHS